MAQDRQDTIVEDQGVDLPDIGSFNPDTITPPLKHRVDLHAWINKAERTLRGHNLHNLINTNIPWPYPSDPNVEKWRSLSLQVREWLSSSMDPALLQEIEARGTPTDFADDFIAEVKKHMKSQTHGALKAAVHSFRKLSRSQFTTSEEFLRTLKRQYRAICALNGNLPPYYPLEAMLSELAEIPELSVFILVKDNELNAIEDPVETITINDFYRYSTAILDYIKSRNADYFTL
ncbi:uncharacterized protein N7515_009819 [Penicillium bovifimosum]|uniref:Uncharacterized protein n=1 Tax=Penicillium bovifimosum TaxID=126998 RepID=A0A9W9GHN5_9EURO|nr:uncharacterized protein N7515_009819 [Penicillium bovifimosum]KAJ5120431.1 hypothetical protein N7515_009819 [Penicillium bovifimosum]